MSDTVGTVLLTREQIEERAVSYTHLSSELRTHRQSDNIQIIGGNYLMSKYDENKQLRCSFCGKPQSQVTRLVAGPGVYILSLIHI